MRRRPQGSTGRDGLVRRTLRALQRARQLRAARLGELAGGALPLEAFLCARHFVAHRGQLRLPLRICGRQRLRSGLLDLRGPGARGSRVGPHGRSGALRGRRARLGGRSCALRGRLRRGERRTRSLCERLRREPCRGRLRQRVARLRQLCARVRRGPSLVRCRPRSVGRASLRRGCPLSGGGDVSRCGLLGRCALLAGRRHRRRRCRLPQQGRCAAGSLYLQQQAALPFLPSTQ